MLEEGDAYAVQTSVQRGLGSGSPGLMVALLKLAMEGGGSEICPSLRPAAGGWNPT